MKRNIYIISAVALLIAVLLFLKFGSRSRLTAPDAASASNKLPSANAASQQAATAGAAPSPGMRSPGKRVNSNFGALIPLVSLVP
jgi:hypothetical protein